MFINNFDPVAFQVFSFEFRWYSFAYIFGLILGWIYCKKLIIKDQSIKNIFDDYITYLIIGIIVGGRLGYVLIYDPVYFLNNINEIPMIWNGGMSFHGGVIGIIILGKYTLVKIVLFTIKLCVDFVKDEEKYIHGTRAT